MSRKERLHMTDEEWERYQRRYENRMEQHLEDDFLNRVIEQRTLDRAIDEKLIQRGYKHLVPGCGGYDAETARKLNKLDKLERIRREEFNAKTSAAKNRNNGRDIYDKLIIAGDMLYSVNDLKDEYPDVKKLAIVKGWLNSDDVVSFTYFEKEYKKYEDELYRLRHHKLANYWVVTDAIKRVRNGEPYVRVVCFDKIINLYPDEDGDYYYSKCCGDLKAVLVSLLEWETSFSYVGTNNRKENITRDLEDGKYRIDAYLEL